MKKIPEKIKEIRGWVAKQEAGSKSISFSQLSVYLNCPKCWERSYILKEAPFVPSIHLIFGTAIHEVLQEWLDLLYNKTIKEANEMDMAGLLQSKMRDLYTKEKTSLGKDFSTAEEMADFYESGVAILDYVRKHRKEHFNTKDEWLVGCEIPILFPLRDRFYFKGFIDVLLFDEFTGRWKIIDFKTSTAGWHSEKSDKHKTNQVLLYKYFLSKQFNIDIDTIDVEYLIVKRKLPENQEFPAMSKRIQTFIPANKKPSINSAVKDVENFCKDVLLETGGYQQKDYTATPSEKSCKWCVFRDTCQFHS